MKTKRWTYTLIGIVVAVGIYSFRGAKILNKNKHSHPTYSEFKGRAGQQGNAEEAAESTMQYGGKAIELPAFVQNARYPEQILYRTGYTVSYNSVTKLPNWVSWQLTADKTDGENERKSVKFFEDNEVPMERATPADYKNSGYDRGHMCPAGDNKWDRTAMRESFLMTNVCPQVHSLNAGDWNSLEQACRSWAVKYGSVYIVCGPILYRGEHQTIGLHKVVVPDAFFKVVLRMGASPKAIGFIYRNTNNNRPWGDYVNSVDEVERITGYDFFPALSDDIEKRVEASANLNDWR